MAFQPNKKYKPKDYTYYKSGVIYNFAQKKLDTARRVIAAKAQNKRDYKNKSCVNVKRKDRSIKAYQNIIKKAYRALRIIKREKRKPSYKKLQNYCRGKARRLRQKNDPNYVKKPRAKKQKSLASMSTSQELTPNTF